MIDLGENDKIKNLSRDCPVDIYLSGMDGANNGNTYFPWAYRMGTPKDNNSSYYNDCDSYILDSGIMHDDITNDDVINTALEINPDYIVAADVLHNQEKTTERVLDFLDMVDDYNINADIIIPLQPSKKNKTDHYKHYKEIEGQSDYYAIGGVMNTKTENKYESAKHLRQVCGDDIHLHGFSFDISYFNSYKIIENPIINSLDSSSPIHMGQKGKSWTFNGGVEVIEYPEPEDYYSLLQVSMHSGLTLVTTARLILNSLDIDEITISKSNSHSNKRIEHDKLNGFIEVSAKAHSYAKQKYPDLPLSLAIAILLYTESEFGGYT